MKKYIIITLLAILALTVQAQETIKIVPKFKVGQKMLYHVRLENEDRASLSDSFYTNKGASFDFDIEVVVKLKIAEGWKISSVLKNIKMDVGGKSAFEDGMVRAFGMENAVADSKTMLKSFENHVFHLTLNKEGKFLRYDNKKELDGFIYSCQKRIYISAISGFYKTLNEKVPAYLGKEFDQRYAKNPKKGEMLKSCDMYRTYVGIHNGDIYQLGESFPKSINRSVTKDDSGIFITENFEYLDAYVKEEAGRGKYGTKYNREYRFDKNCILQSSVNEEIETSSLGVSISREIVSLVK